MFDRRRHGVFELREEPDTVFMPEGDSMTKQSEVANSDIHAIMAKYFSGVLVDFNQRDARYGDFTTGGDLLECLNRVREAERAFMELPSEVRDYVDNDPSAFLDLVYDPSRAAECEALGLVPRAPEGAAAAAPAAAAAAIAAPVGPSVPPAS